MSHVINPVLLSIAIAPAPFIQVTVDSEPGDTRVIVKSDGWELIGDLRLPEADGPVPAVLMLNKAAGYLMLAFATHPLLAWLGVLRVLRTCAKHARHCPLQYVFRIRFRAGS